MTYLAMGRQDEGLRQLDPQVAAAYLAHWQDRWAQGVERKD